MFVIIQGNRFDCATIWGPFKTKGDALNWAQAHYDCQEEEFASMEALEDFICGMDIAIIQLQEP